MRVLSVLLLALLLPLAARGQAEKAELLAGLYGETLGAAAQCPAIAAARVDAAAGLASKHVKELAGKAADAAGNELAAGIARGQREVTDGAVTCAQAESELSNLERDLSH